MSNVPIQSEESGLAPNLAGALAYLFAPLGGILFLVVEKKNAFVRFHAAQSVVFGVAFIIAWVALAILGMILAAVPIIGWLIGVLLTFALWVVGFVLWLMLSYRAYQGKEWELPVIGVQARKLIGPPPAVQ
ncbi:MAG TPA: DUF4870 domain-containing protein [Gemmatimonadaceae bacterium]|nr:DUF4870 domain-containing protein [Gemmatimonadaceae bacterium]